MLRFSKCFYIKVIIHLYHIHTVFSAMSSGMLPMARLTNGGVAAGLPRRQRPHANIYPPSHKPKWKNCGAGFEPPIFWSLDCVLELSSQNCTTRRRQSSTEDWPAAAPGFLVEK